MFTRPDDLADETVWSTLAARWEFEPVALEYRPVGFGSHHWRAVARSGDERFVTVDDLLKNLHSTPDGTADAASARFERAHRTAHALAVDGALDFVVAPLLTTDGEVTVRVDDRYTMVVHPHLDGRPAVDDGGFRSAADRASVLAHIVALHAATDVAAPYASAEEGFLPGRDELTAALDDVESAWSTGPYGEGAQALLCAHASGVRALLAHYDELVVGVCADRERMVITHGEPDAHNVVIDATGPKLVDWESALVAPPERDLYALDPGHGSVVAAYTEATGVVVSTERLDYYRLWYDLFEIAGYLELFRAPHVDSADAAESWKNLVEFLQPERRWPALFR